jgi:hypothetical protein
MMPDVHQEALLKKYLASTPLLAADVASTIPKHTRTLEANTGVDQALEKQVAGIWPVEKMISASSLEWAGDVMHPAKDACLSITMRRGERAHHPAGPVSSSCHVLIML